jgi:signal transduction histidine kinase/HAMP domain-containing protein
VVLELPYTAVLETAAKTAGPLLFVQVGFGLLLGFAIPIFAARMTRPLNSLALAAHRIARGNLTGEVHIEGDDEVAQLGDAFERMRVRLRARLNDLSLLLSIAQEVSATLNLERGILPILEGARTEVSAAIARFVILRDDGRPRRVFSVGDAEGDLARLDQALCAALVRRKEPLTIPNLDQTQRAVPAVAFKSVAAFPVRSQERTVGVLWVGMMTRQAPDEARSNFLSTLASQAAVLMENARLFQTAEGGRQRLAAILASTRDAILVVDSEGRLLLTNPAAQRLLSFDRAAIGRPVEEIGLPEPLVQALAAPSPAADYVRSPDDVRTPVDVGIPVDAARNDGGEIEEPSAPPVEVPMADGRTFYASIAPIRARDGVTDGVVVVMRDVTHFKEVDEMKSEFVATVSHDLKAPLTFMRGYTTMLPMVGPLNERQQSYVERILEGIGQMSTLIGDLLDLRRVEAGVGIDQDPCRLGLVLVEAVEAMRARATAKEINLSLEPSEGAPTIVGDRTLLRQAVSNLVDNAIKYTPENGSVNVGLDTSPTSAIIRISDTGIGIAPEEQPRLFEKFHRIQRREMPNVKGTGLGLALVKSIVDRHGGRVWVESALNKGSTFYVELPIPDKSADTP